MCSVFFPRCCNRVGQSLKRTHHWLMATSLIRLFNRDHPQRALVVHRLLVIKHGGCSISLEASESSSHGLTVICATWKMNDAYMHHTSSNTALLCTATLDNANSEFIFNCGLRTIANAPRYGKGWHVIIRASAFHGYALRNMKIRSHQDCWKD